MRIADIARKYNVSEQAVRNRIKRAGINLNELRKPGSNVLSEKGIAIISAMFERDPAAGSEKGNQESKKGGKAAGSGGALAIVRAERDEWMIKATAAETLAAERQKTIEFLQEQIREKDTTITKLAQSNAIIAQTQAQEQNYNPEQKRRWFPWFRKKGK